MVEHLAGRGGGEPPVHRRPLTVAPRRPGIDLQLHLRDRRQMPPQALLGQDTPFDLDHVQPTPMHRGGVPLQLARDAPRLLSWEGRVERGRSVGVERSITKRITSASGKWRSTNSWRKWAKSWAVRRGATVTVRQPAAGWKAPNNEQLPQRSYA